MVLLYQENSSQKVIQITEVENKNDGNPKKVGGTRLV